MALMNVGYSSSPSKLCMRHPRKKFDAPQIFVDNYGKYKTVVNVDRCAHYSTTIFVLFGCYRKLILK